MQSFEEFGECPVHGGNSRPGARTLTLPNHPTIPLCTARAFAPTAVVSVLTEIHLNPPLTFLNYPHRIAFSDLPILSPTSFTTPLNQTLRRTNRESRMQNPYLPRVRRASGFVQIFLSQVPRRETLGSPRKLTAGALVDRKLRFFANCRQGAGVCRLSCA